MGCNVTTDNNMNIRIATKGDMTRTLEIYSYYVENTNVSFEYDTPSLEEFIGRYEAIIKKYPYLVVELEGKIQGYAYANTFKGRTAYDWGVEMTIYLDKNCVGKGVGTALYSMLESYLRKQNILNLYVSIVYPYPRSILFHEKCGYKKVAHFEKCGYKFNEWHDMTWMEKVIGEHKKDTPAVIWFEELEKDL